MTQRLARPAPLAQWAWKQHSEAHWGKEAQEQMLAPDCRALPALTCPGDLQDFLVQGFLEPAQRDNLHDE